MLGFSNFGNGFGGNGFSGNGFGGRFRNAEENDKQNIDNHEFRYASPYDEPEYTPPKPKYVPPTPAPYHPAPYHPSSMRCPQNLLVGCAPQVQYVPCQQP